MKLKMKMESVVVAPVGGRLMQRHNIGKRHLPKVVEFNCDLLQDLGKIA
jgi:hypothetical protein